MVFKENSQFLIPTSLSIIFPGVISQWTHLLGVDTYESALKMQLFPTSCSLVARSERCWFNAEIRSRLAELRVSKHQTVIYKNSGKHEVREILWMQITYIWQWITPWKRMESTQECWLSAGRLHATWKCNNSKIFETSSVQLVSLLVIEYMKCYNCTDSHFAFVLRKSEYPALAWVVDWIGYTQNTTREISFQVYKSLCHTTRYHYKFK